MSTQIIFPESGRGLRHVTLQFLAYARSCFGLSSVLRPSRHSISYMGDGFYGSKDPTNSIKVLKEHIVHRQIKQADI